MSTRISRTTKKKNKKAYLRICVREPPKPGCLVLTNRMSRRLPHVTYGLSHAQLTKKLKTDIPDTNPIHHPRTIIMNIVKSPVVRTRAPDKCITILFTSVGTPIHRFEINQDSKKELSQSYVVQIISAYDHDRHMVVTRHHLDSRSHQ